MNRIEALKELVQQAEISALEVGVSLDRCQSSLYRPRDRKVEAELRSRIKDIEEAVKVGREMIVELEDKERGFEKVHGGWWLDIHKWVYGWYPDRGPLNGGIAMIEISKEAAMGRASEIQNIPDVLDRIRRKATGEDKAK